MCWRLLLVYSICIVHTIFLLITLFETGIAALMMRQTSIVWTILVAMGCLDLALQNNLFTKKELKQEELVSTPKQIVVKPVISFKILTT